MHSSYSLHIPKEKTPTSHRRKRKVIPYALHSYQTYKYRCLDCQGDVFFAPGHELICTHCAGRTVEKVCANPKKRQICAR